MVATKTFHDVSPRAWERMQDIGRVQHGTVFETVDGLTGTATTNSPVGTIVLAYAFDPDIQTVTYTIQRKPMLIGEFLIWNGIDATLGHCRRD